jgi:hypothetical protein
MDEIQSKILNQFNSSNTKIITLFYFPVNSTTFCINKVGVEKYDFKQACWKGKEDLFKALHLKLLEIAKNNIDIDVVIKTKPEFMKNITWDFYLGILEDSGINYKELRNYKVEPYVNVHSLINKSNVICGLQSSSTVESIFLEKKVVVPLFNGFHNTKYYDQFPWREYEDLFCVAEDVDIFEHELLAVFDKNSTPYIINSNRKKELFKECFGFDDSESLSRYEKVISNNVNK